MKTVQNVLAGIAVGLGLISLGCTESRKSTINAEGPQGLFRPATEQFVSATEYRVSPPDKLTIKAPGIKELDNLSSQIRPDGKISVNLLGEIYVANKTPEEINKILTDAANKYYNNPDVKVEVADYASKFYFVNGYSLGSQGKKPFTGRDTVISALAEAGFNDGAWPQQVALSRPAKNGHDKATAIIDFKEMAMTGELRQNYLIEEGDIVYVPDSPLESWSKITNKMLGPLGQQMSTVSSAQGMKTTKP